MVFHLQVPIPEKPDTDDEAQIKKWKWKVKSVKKVNKERYSQRCDLELKLAVSILQIFLHQLLYSFPLMTVVALWL